MAFVDPLIASGTILYSGDAIPYWLKEDLAVLPIHCLAYMKLLCLQILIFYN